MNIYLAGQTNFGNRGCEALVRSSVGMIKKVLPSTSIICPLENVKRDSKNWPDAVKQDVKYVASPKFPKYLRWWGRANRLLPLARMGLPKVVLDKETISHLKTASALIMTGGDNITLDYGVMALYQWCGMVEKSIDIGIPAVLWAASVGPFNKQPEIEKVIVKHLKRYQAITVRESSSLNYLKTIGVENVELVADPAFCLEPQSCEYTNKLENKGGQFLGLNISPLIRKFRKNNSSALAMDYEVIAFIKKVITKTQLNVILISHVDFCDEQKQNSDWFYLSNIYKALPEFHDNIILAPANLNAAQLKKLIGLCDYFIGARTHSTIAAISQGVPTISIAYSVKAVGINEDLFGHQKYVLKTHEVGSEKLFKSLQLLQKDYKEISNILNDKLPEWRLRANYSAILLKRCLTLN